MTKRALKDLLDAVLEPRKQGAIKKIGEACSAGADPNAICPNRDSPSGRMRAGTTLLTHSIHEWSSNAVKKLLECGADPNLTDELGWTPWMASTLVDESKRDKIQAILSEFGADKAGDHTGQLARAIADGDTDRASQLIQSDEDLQVLSTFRVDLLGLQVSSGNTAMIEFLLEHGMQPSSTNFLNTVRLRKPAALELLLRHGVAPERPDEKETPLMTAAIMGDMDLVRQLVEAGADVNRYADDKGECTPSFYARQAGHNEVADWLTERMSGAARHDQAVLKAGRDPKYQLLYEQATASELISTDEIVAALTAWDELYGLTVSHARGDRVGMTFDLLPENLDDFYMQIVDLCPDASGHKKSLISELKNKKRLYLWWD